MIVILNATDDDICIRFKDEHIDIEPKKIIKISETDFRYVKLSDHVVNIDSGVIIIKGVI